MLLESRLLTSHEGMQSKDNFSILLDCKKDQLISDLCSGKKTLPTPRYFDYLSLYNQNENVEKLIFVAKETSQKFYLNTFSAALRFRDDFQEFSEYFQEHIQPLGQTIIDLMILINMYEFDVELKKSGSFFTKIINHTRLRLQQKLVKKHKLASSVNRVIMFFTITIFSLLSFYFAGNYNSLFLSIPAAAVTFISGTILSIALYKKHDFELTDISGRNLIAVKYRTAFYFELAAIEKKANEYAKYNDDFCKDYKIENVTENKIFEMA